MVTWLFWSLAAVLGLIGVAVLVAGWELVRRDLPTTAEPMPSRVHTIDLHLGELNTSAAGAAPPESASAPTDSDARRRALAHAMVRMSEPARPARESWEDTQPSVNLPAAARTPPA